MKTEYFQLNSEYLLVKKQQQKKPTKQCFSFQSCLDEEFYTMI